jgi:hypothetical protein
MSKIYSFVKWIIFLFFLRNSHKKTYTHVQKVCIGSFPGTPTKVQGRTVSFFVQRWERKMKEMKGKEGANK